MSAPRVLPSPTDEAGRADPLLVHRLVHPVPQADCDLCPPTECPCGAGVRCPGAFDHRREYVASEARWPR